MLFGLLMTLFTINCLLLILLILIQQGKSSMGLGAMGGSTQMLFGGSGGQDIFQKITWVMGAIFMLGSLTLSLQKSRTSSQYLTERSVRMANQRPMASSKAAEKPAPVEQTEEAA
jgi:protein translocase SecG subunit